MDRSCLDAVTFCFETVAAVLAWVNVRAIWRDRTVRGIWWPGTLFFLAWAAWGFVFYPQLGMAWSEIALAIRFVAQALWVGMVIWWRNK